MNLPEKGCLLRIYVGETDKTDGKPLYEAIVLKAREMGMAGATVLRGIMGYGASSRVHSAKLLDISGDLPVVVEIVDTEEKIERFMPWLDEKVREGLVTLEEIKVVHYRAGKLPN